MKIAQWWLKTVLTVILISGLTILTTGAVVNAYIQSVLSSFNIQLEGQSLGLGSIMKGMFGIKPATEKNSKDPVNSTDNKASSDTVGSSSSAENANTSETDQAENDTEPTDSHSPPDNALPVMGGLGEAQESQSVQDQQVIVSPDDMVKRKDGLTETEKQQIFDILMKKLPQEEMQTISSAMEGGLTEQELQEIEEIISKYLSEDEYTALKKLLEE